MCEYQRGATFAIAYLVSSGFRHFSFGFRHSFHGCGGMGCISPCATFSWYCVQLIFDSPLVSETMVMQSSTGQTSEQRLQPTQSASRTLGMGLPGTRPGPRP